MTCCELLGRRVVAHRKGQHFTAIWGEKSPVGLTLEGPHTCRLERGPARGPPPPPIRRARVERTRRVSGGASSVVVLQSCGAVSNSERLIGVHPMNNLRSPRAKKKRAEIGGRKRSIRDVLLRPQTWKIAASALSLVLKLVRVVLKVWDMFQ